MDQHGTENDGFQICLIGAGPRGLSVLERLCANERARPSHPAVRIHVVDPSAPGAGRVWRPDQSRHLLMNTVASQITVYTDDSVRAEGPVEPGPSLHDWARHLTGAAAGGEHGAVDPCDAEDGELLAEARSLDPDDYPTRAFYGRYLNAQFRRVVAGAPAHVTVQVHPSRAVALADTHGFRGGPQGIRLEDGTRLNKLDAVVMAQGHVPTRLTSREARTAGLACLHQLTYLTPANPADLDLSGLAPGQNVLLRGLGLNFFDHMALLTVGNGGRFVREEGRLRYVPSGNEPRLYASSRRGVPYHARGENEKGAHGRHLPRVLTPEVIEDLRARSAARGGLSFATDLWPLITREVEAVYYGTLLTSLGRDAEREEFTLRFVALEDAGERAALLDEFGIEDGDVRWDWQRLARPYRQHAFADHGEWRSWLLAHLERDVAEARAGNVSGPLKAALDVLRDLRNEIRLVVDHGGLTGDSYRDDLEGWYTPLNAFLSIGPPVSRIEEMIALIEAGVLDITGPGTEIRIDTSTGPRASFVAQSREVPGPPVRAGVLIEARLPEPDLRRTDDPLLRHLLYTEQCTAYRIRGIGGTSYESGGLAVTERPYRLLDAHGRAHPRRYAYGIPTESVHWATAAGIRPGVDSVTLGDSDAIARAVLALPPASASLPEDWPVTAELDPTGVLV